MTEIKSQLEGTEQEGVGREGTDGSALDAEEGREDSQD